MATNRFKVKVYLKEEVNRTKGQPPVKVTRWTYMLAHSREEISRVKTNDGVIIIYRYFGRYANGAQWKLRDIDAFVNLVDAVFQGRYKVHDRPINAGLAHKDDNE
ncbi:hypothetical protein ACAW74_25840 [Fibrella sp. WM1]|uniref:hypothetical protein n=1 Tax=Fibrella musci TaxID=3242485 RepID=UPI00351FDA86